MPTSNAEELGLFLKCTVIGRGVFGPCACCSGVFLHPNQPLKKRYTKSRLQRLRLRRAPTYSEEFLLHLQVVVSEIRCTSVGDPAAN